MKKIIAIITLLFVGITYAQQSQTKPNFFTKEVIKEVAEQLTSISTKLAGVGIQGFGIGVKWYWKNALAHLLTNSIGFLMTFIMALILFTKGSRSAKENGGWENGISILCAIFGCIASTAAIITFVSALSSIAGVVAPEYNFLMSILNGGGNQ